MSRLTRRSFLRAAGATGLATTVAGCGSFLPGDGRRTPRGPARRTPRSSEFGTVVDVGAAAGGGSVVPALEENAGDDTLLYFPPGRYRMDEPFELYDFEGLGIVGHGATVVPPKGFTDVLFDLGRPDRATGLLVEGIEFDIRQPGTGPRPLLAQVADDLTLRDVAVVGRQDEGEEMLRVDVTHPDGEGLVEGLVLPDGAAAGTGSTGLLVGDDNRGHVAFVDCHIEGFPDNGLYAEPPEGSITVEGGRFANCDVASLRVGGDSTVRGATVVCDRAPEGFGNMRGIRLRQGSDVLVEDCTVEFRDVTGSDGAITGGHWLESATVRSTGIRIDTDEVNAIQLKDPQGDTPGDGPITFEDVEITGAAGGQATVEVVQRGGCTFDRVTVRQEGDARDGFLFDQSRGTVRDCVIQVSGRPFVLQDGATVDRVNVRTTRPGTTSRAGWWPGVLPLWR